MTVPPKFATAGVQKLVLENGATFVADPAPGSRSVCICICLRGGLRGEQPQTAGITHLLEHLLFRRTAARTPREIARAIDSFGGDVNGFTDTDGLYLFAHVPAGSAGPALRFLAELLLESTFNEQDVKLEQDVIRQEILDARDNPATVVYEAFCGRLWQGSQLALPVYGSIESVSSFNLAALEELRENLRCGARLLIAAAGGVNPEEFFALSAELFGKLPAGARPALPHPSTHSGLELQPQGAEQAYLTLGFPWPSLLNPDYYSGLAASAILGEMMSSRLFQEIRESRGLAYDVSSEVDAHADTAAMLVNLTVEPKNLEPAIEVLLEQLEQMRREVREGELELAVQSLAAHLIMTSDSIGARMWRCLENELFFGRHIPIEEVLARVKELSAERLTADCRSWLQPGRGCAVLGGEVEGFDPGEPLHSYCGGRAG